MSIGSDGRVGFRRYFLLSGLLLIQFANVLECSLDAERLYAYLMRDYSKLIRPVDTNEEALQVLLQLKFTQLIGVDEVNQVITTNVIVKQTWRDYKLKWNPDDFGGISTISIPSENIWLPDIVLYNNAEGDYQITKMTKLVVNYTGDVLWDPPAIYKSYCPINVRYFPYSLSAYLKLSYQKNSSKMSVTNLLKVYNQGLTQLLHPILVCGIDKQECDMKFGSWTFDASLVDLKPSRGFVADAKIIPIGMDLSEYKPSIEWDILKASAVRNKLIYSYGTYVDITFNLVIRRKTLFYTVNLMIPCILISFLTIFVFYLPCDSGEKVTLCISILLSLTVFILLLAEIIPPTSLAVPLLGRYLLFTLVLTTMSIALTIIVINVHFRNPSTHKMPPWVRTVFLHFLPKLLLIERPPGVQSDDEDLSSNGAVQRSSAAGDRNPWNLFSLQEGAGFASPRGQKNILLNQEVQDAVKGINFIVEHVRETNKFANTVRDWKYCALVLDRLFLWIFALICLVGTGKIVLDAPPLYETDEPIPRACVNPETEDNWICIFKTNED